MDDLLEKLRDTPCNREPFTPAHADCQCRVAHAAADEIVTLRAAATRAVSIIDVNLNRQSEKVQDAAYILREALQPKH